MKKKLTKIFLINEYEELEDAEMVYIRSTVFTKLDDASSYKYLMVRNNTRIKGDSRYEMESDFLFQDYKTAIEKEGLE